MEPPDKLFCQLQIVNKDTEKPWWEKSLSVGQTHKKQKDDSNGE